MTTPLSIRQSELQSFMRCRRKWMLEYRRKLVYARTTNQPVPNLAMGSIMHKAVELFWSEGKDPVRTIVEVEQEVISKVEGGLSAEWVEIFKYLRVMMQGYKEWVKNGDTMGEEVVSVEQALIVPWGTFNGYDVTLTGKLDRKVKDTFTDQLMLIDTKSTQSFARGMTHHFQLLTYAVMLRRLSGERIDRLMTEQIRKVLRSATSKPPFFDRIEMYVNEEMLDNHEAHLDRLVGDITRVTREFERGDIYECYPHPTRDCSWDCDYLPICTQMDDGSDYEYTIERSYRIRPTEDTYI